MSERKNVYHSNFFAMGTRMDIVLPMIDNEHGDLIFNEIKTETTRLEKKLSRFNPESEIYKINHKAHKEPFKIDSELHQIVQQSLNFNKKTNGYFDITTRPVLENYIRKATDTEINKLKEQLGVDNVILLPDSIYLKNNIIELDFGGIGKGYALRNINKILLQHKLESAFVSFGESSILAYGKHPFGEYWGVGIKHLFNSSNVSSFMIQNKSLSTSGITPSNQKKHDGHAHLINPKTGQKLNNNKTVTVVSDSPIDAEVLSTALMVCEENEIKEIIENFDVSDVIEILYKNRNNYESKIHFIKNK